MSEIKATIIDVAWHRNGVSGAGFYSVLFEEAEWGLMHASLFDEPGYCAVHQVQLLADKNIKFAQNSWRGDAYEAVLRPLVKKVMNTGRVGPFSLPVL